MHGLILAKYLIIGLDMRDVYKRQLFIYPQLLINTPVHDKHAALEDKELLAAVDAVAQELGDEGRILVRPSGTEPLVRVMRCV